MAKKYKKYKTDNIDWETVDKLLQAQCGGEGIASKLGIHYQTLQRACKEIKKMNFVEYSMLKRGEGVELLRAKQFQTAMNGNVTMQIWLGKQYLGQRDRTEADTNIKLNGGVSIFEQMQKENESENTDKTKSQ